MLTFMSTMNHTQSHTIYSLIKLLDINDISFCKLVQNNFSGFGYLWNYLIKILNIIHI